MNGGGGKRKTTSEAPYNVVLGGGGGGCSSVLFDGVDLGGVDGGVVQNFERNEGTQLQKSEEDEESHVEVDEEEGVEKEEEGIEGEEEDEEGSDGGGGVVLGENFFEVEAIRRKRVRKGQVQYLIKWNGWPETTNTWEPPENLEFIPDMVEAFEERLKSGKHHKRKRKHVMHCTRTKKCNHTQSAPTLNDPSLHDVFAFPQTMLFYDGAKSSSLGKATPSNANKSANGSEQNMKKNEETDYDPKTTIASGNDSDRLAIQNPEAKSKLKDIYGYIKTFLTKVSQHFK